MSYDLKECKDCHLLKHIDDFQILKINKNGTIARRAVCKKCYYQRQKPHKIKYEQENAEILSLKRSQKYLEDRENKLIKQKEYYENNKESKKEYNKNYYLENKQSIQEQQNISRKNRRKRDPIYKMREDISTIVRRVIKSNNSSKKISVMKYLPYTIYELKIHIESQFEDWMNWNNQGRYIKSTWNDNDPSTWTWQIDHIIPQSDLPYSSMNDDNFKKCWSLENIRPLKSDLNHQDGVKRTRHIKRGESNVI